MKDAQKFLYIPDKAKVPEPMFEHGNLFTLDSITGGGGNLTPEQFLGIKNQHVDDLSQVAPDLKSRNLATVYTDLLFKKISESRPDSIEAVIREGSIIYYQVGRETLGPLAVSFVDAILKQIEGVAIFPARDATPFFYVAKALKMLNPSRYAVELENILNPVFNRKLWGVEDEQDPESEVLPVSHPLVQKLLHQLGFGSSVPKSFIEVGCWGTMVDQLKRSMPHENYSVFFLYTHLPENIYGFINIHGGSLPESSLETIADTWEAFPKPFKRPTVLIEHDGIVKSSLEGKTIESPYLHAWTEAALQGVVDAARDFAFGGYKSYPEDELAKLASLSHEASNSKVFTGMLPWHTETWSDGEAWKTNWQWGKISPLK